LQIFINKILLNNLLREKMVDKKLIFAGLIVLGVILVVGAIYFLMPGGQIGVTNSNEVNALTIYHWWTSPGEVKAINSLVTLFNSKYPDTAVMPTSIVGGVGGGGASLLAIVKPMTSAGQAPDIFQTNGGYSAKQYYDLGVLENTNDVWKSANLEAVVPSIVQDVCSFGGNHYGVPVDIHRTNVVWYNKPLLDKYNIDASTLTNWNSFFAACDNLRVSGITYPIQMAAPWTAEMVFEGILASEGMEFYQDWSNGKVVDPQDPKLLDALNTFKKYISYINADNANLGWDVAVARVISGQSAFNTMGDYANGEFAAANKTYNTDYGTFPVPGTTDMYGMSIDVFLHPKGSTHPTNAEKWLEMVASREGQDTFNPFKGSISARTDTEVNKYAAYQQTSIAGFWSAKSIYPAISHAVPHAAEAKMQSILAQFTIDGDVNKAASAFTDYTKEIIDSYTITWSLT
jgi:glucose/mannose transport system substrate-binding protein